MNDILHKSIKNTFFQFTAMVTCLTSIHVIAFYGFGIRCGYMNSAASDMLISFVAFFLCQTMFRYYYLHGEMY